jgi:predicted GH43/DUF377 family glycosyl hydrolase
MGLQWKKHGLLFSSENFSWSEHSALQPTPLVLDDRIRVYVGTRDKDGVSRVGFVDLDRKDPRNILGYSKASVLDVGENGCFDESGVVPSAVVNYEGKIYLFYAGYQLGTKVRFSVLGGVAISRDNGYTFSRVKKTPAFERNDEELLFRVPHSVIVKDGKWCAWYGGGSSFQKGKDKTLPLYDIRYVESESPLNFGKAGSVIIKTQGQEYRLGRPYVFSLSNKHYMFYGYSTESSPYQLGYATSDDLKEWERCDDLVGLEISKSGWDSEMMAYPSVIQLGSKVYMFYNGRNYGREGFGLAELIK